MVKEKEQLIDDVLELVRIIVGLPELEMESLERLTIRELVLLKDALKQQEKIINHLSDGVHMI